MATNFPSSLDSLTNPTSTDKLDVVAHSSQHINANDAIEALEAKVGINGSAVTTSHDYKLSEVTSTDKAVGKTATQTLTNKTLTAPQINMGSDATGDMYYRNGSAVTTRLPIGTTGQILEAQASGIPAWVANPAATNASTTAKGVSEEATLAETLARTGTGTTGARTFVNPENLTTVQTYDYAADAGGTDAYAITVTPAPTAYVTGQVFRFKANTANTGTATLNVNSLGAKTIKKPAASAPSDLATGDIIANQIVEVVYNGTDFVTFSTLSASPQGIDAGVVTAVSGITSTTTTDRTVTLTYQPRLIMVTYYIQGTRNLDSQYTVEQGVAIFSGTTLISKNVLGTSTNTGGDNLPGISNTQGEMGVDPSSTSSISVGETTNNSISMTLTINSVSSTGFVLRFQATASGGSSSKQARGKASYVAFS